MDSITYLLEKKGWALYEVSSETSNALEKIISKGRVSNIESNKYYTILPLASDTSNLNEVTHHLEVARKTNQQPKYIAREQKFIIDGIEIVNEVLHLHLSHTAEFYVKVEKDDIERTLQQAISNYNTWFFSSIDELLKVARIPTQHDSILPKQLRWELVHKDNSKFIILYPSDANPIFFRGQNIRHQPCYPSISRNISTRSPILGNLTFDEQVLIAVRMIKTEWFCKLLKETPHYEWHKTQNIWMDTMSLAQHYELPTGLIDLTQSIDVASFFACCKFENDGSWSPMKSGEGVIYSLDLRIAYPEQRKVSAIGQQIFPRPSEQWGWTCEMTLNEDFDLLPYVRKYIFRHNEESSQRILKAFSYGKDLFPTDPLSELAKKVKESKKLPSMVVFKVLDDLMSDDKGLLETSKDSVIKAIKLQYEILNEINLLDEDLLDKLKQSWDDKKSDLRNNIGSVGFRLIRTKK